MNNPIFSAGILIITTASLVVNGCKSSDYEIIPSTGREPLIEPSVALILPTKGRLPGEL
jgi:hypothetical protein